MDSDNARSTHILSRRSAFSGQQGLGLVLLIVLGTTFVAIQGIIFSLRRSHLRRAAALRSLRVSQQVPGQPGRALEKPIIHNVRITRLSYDQAVEWRDIMPLSVAEDHSATPSVTAASLQPSQTTGRHQPYPFTFLVNRLFSWSTKSVQSTTAVTELVEREPDIVDISIIVELPRSTSDSESFRSHATLPEMSIGFVRLPRP